MTGEIRSDRSAGLPDQPWYSWQLLHWRLDSRWWPGEANQPPPSTIRTPPSRSSKFPNPGISHRTGDGAEDTPGNDQAWAGNGNDQIWGSTGADVIRAGNGADTVDGGGGPDVLLGGADHDVLHGGRGRDDISGNDGDDRLSGGDHDDVLRGHGGFDTCDGGAAVAGDAAYSCERTAGIL